MRRLSLASIVLGVLSGACMASVLLFEFFPSQDGPIHLSSNWVLAHFDDAGESWLKSFYTVHPPLGPYWLVYLLLSHLMKVMHPLAAEKVFLCVYFVLFALAARYAVKAVNKRSSFAAVLLFVLAGHYFFHMGFYNFSVSLIVFLGGVGYWLRHSRSLEWKHYPVLMVLFALAYYSHLVTLAELCLFIAAVELSALIRERRPDWKGWSIGFLACLPVLALAGLFMTTEQSTSSDLWYQDGLAGRVNFLVRMSMLLAYGYPENYLAKALLGICVLMGIGALFRPGTGDAHMRWKRKTLGAWFVLTVAAYFTAPFAGVNATYISTRMSLYVVIAGILWLASFEYTAVLRRLFLGAGTAVVVLFIIAHTQVYAQAQPLLKDYLSVSPHIKPHTTVLDLTWAQVYQYPRKTNYSVRTDALKHAWGHLVYRNRVVGLSNNMKESFWPVSVSSWLALDRNGSRVDTIPPVFDIRAYERETGARVDYVVMWDYPRTPEASEAYRKFLPRLEADYHIVHRTPPPKGKVRLYARDV